MTYHAARSDKLALLSFGNMCLQEYYYIDILH